jgi:hypothetical protein
VFLVPALEGFEPALYGLKALLEIAYGTGPLLPFERLLQATLQDLQHLIYLTEYIDFFSSQIVAPPSLGGGRAR